MTVRRATLDRVEEAQWLREAGESWTAIARRLDTTLAALEISFRRSGVKADSDLYRRCREGRAHRPRPKKPCPRCGGPMARTSRMCRPCNGMAQRDPCGTYGGYKSHLRDNTPVCTPCTEAKRAYHRRWWAANRDRNPLP